MASAVTSIYNNIISAASAGFAPTNSADVSALASAYQVVSATATQLYAGTAYVTSVNEAPVSAARAGNAANASLATSAYYDGTGRLISALPDSAAVSAIASSYVESGVSGKQDTLSFAYNGNDQISSINGSALGGMDEAAVSGIASAYAESAVSSKADSSALSSYALSADVSGTVDLVSTQSANWGGSALALSAGPGVKLEKVGNTLVASTDETLLWSGSCLRQGSAAVSLSESASNFEKIELYAVPNPSDSFINNPQIFAYPGSTTAGAYLCPFMTTGLKGKFSCGLWTIASGTSFNLIAAGQSDSYPTQNWDASYGGVVKVVGINRTAEA